MRNILDRLIIVRYQQNIPHLFPPLNVEVCAVEVGGTALARNARSAQCTSTGPTRRDRRRLEIEI